MKTIPFLLAALGSIATSQAALTTGLVNYYNFDDLNNHADASAADNLTNYGNGALVGQAGGVHGNAATFDGTANQGLTFDINFGRIVAGDAESGASLSTLGQNFTVSTWYNLATGASASGRFSVTEAVNNYDVSFGLRSFDQPGDGLADGQTYAGTAANILHTDAHTAGTWQHLILSYSSDGTDTTTSTYLNGVKVGGDLVSADAVIGSIGMNIGRSRNGTNTRTFNGQIDEFATWDRVLDSSEISQVYNNGLNGLAVTAVPEPSASALIGLGGLALILRRRK